MKTFILISGNSLKDIYEYQHTLLQKMYVKRYNVESIRMVKIDELITYILYNDFLIIATEETLRPLYAVETATKLLKHYGDDCLVVSVFDKSIGAYPLTNKNFLMFGYKRYTGEGNLF